MSITGTQRDNTRNQSILDFSRENVFIYGNRYEAITFVNNGAAAATFNDGHLLVRNPADATQVVPAIAGDTLANVIGFLKIDGPLEVAKGGQVACNVCISGDIDEGLITLPDTVTLESEAGPAGSKILRDQIQSLGFVLKKVTDNTKQAN